MEDKNFSVRAEIDRKRISAREKEKHNTMYRHDTLPLLGNTRGNRDAGKFTRYICQEDKENKTRSKTGRIWVKKNLYVCVCYVKITYGSNKQNEKKNNNNNRNEILSFPKEWRKRKISRFLRMERKGILGMGSSFFPIKFPIKRTAIKKQRYNDV